MTETTKDVALSPTQSLILSLMQQGKNNKEIGVILSIKQKTVSTQVSRMMQKYQVNRRRDLPGVSHNLTIVQAEIIAMYNAGKTISAISAASGFYVSSYLTRLRRKGLLPYRRTRSGA